MSESTKRLRVIRRVVIGSLVILAAIIAWRMTSLRGLPDIGDPFDVVAFSELNIPDDENAFVLYRQAVAKYKDFAPVNIVTTNWTTLAESDRKGLESNREALLLWKRGTERMRALDVPPTEIQFESGIAMVQSLRQLVRLANLEGSRLEVAGDFSAAWDWYRASFRCSRHCGQHGSTNERVFGMVFHRVASQRIQTWASNPKVDTKLLRLALDEYQDIDRMTAPNSDWIKAEYLSLIRLMDQPDLLWKQMNVNIDNSGHVNLRPALLRVQATLQRDHQRSRRVLRLVVANWLAHCDRPISERPPFIQPSKLLFVAVRPSPLNHSDLTDEELASWFKSTIFLRRLSTSYESVLAAADRERLVYDQTLLHLARELFAREHGKPPASDDELVGPYLKSLPGELAPGSAKP